MHHYGRTSEFDDCFVEGDHKGCPFTTGPLSTGFYYECSCECHEARECAAANDEGAARRRDQFHADVEHMIGEKFGPF